MVSPIRQRIKDLVGTTLGTITVSNGYQQTVQEVAHDQRDPLNVKGYPAIYIMDRGDRDTRLIQGIYEARMLLELRAQLEDGDRSTRETEVSILAGDCIRAIMTKERPPLNVWNGLAVQTLLQSADLHSNDAQDPYGWMFLVVEILYRTPQGNPFQVALI